MLGLLAVVCSNIALAIQAMLPCYLIIVTFGVVIHAAMWVVVKHQVMHIDPEHSLRTSICWMLKTAKN